MNSQVLPPKVAIVLASGLEAGVATNVSACVAAGLAASAPDWAGRPLVDATGLRSVASSHLPITILRAELPVMRSLLQQLTAQPAEAGCSASLFPAYARTMHDCTEYWQRHAGAVHLDEEILGLGLHGPKRWVSRLTGSLPLWR